MPDIAKLDAYGVLVAVEIVSAPDHVTDPRARTVALPAGHDMATRLGAYRYDWNRSCFLPISREPLDVAEREAPGLVEGLVEFVEQQERDGATVPAKTRAAVKAWRRGVRRAPAMTQATDLGQIANVPGASYRTRVNAGFQAVSSLHYGTSAPSPTYPLMTWADQSTGKIWQRDAANTAWAEIGVIGPPFAWTAVAGSSGGGFSTGDVKATLRAVADSGWVLMDDGSIGGASSGATSRANTDCQDLFLLLWANVSNTWAPLQDASGTPVGRGASAAADWAANRRLVLPKTLGRALASAGWGSGLSDRALGESLGAETHLLGVDELPAHNHPGSTANSNGSHSHSGAWGLGGNAYCPGSVDGSYGNVNTGSGGAHTHTLSVASQGGGQAHNNMPPVSFVNFMVKL